jgi:hypothetical protein
MICGRAGPSVQSSRHVFAIRRAGGLRIGDIADPFRPEELAYSRAASPGLLARRLKRGCIYALSWG